MMSREGLVQKKKCEKERRGKKKTSFMCVFIMTSAIETRHSFILANNINEIVLA